MVYRLRHAKRDSDPAPPRPPSPPAPRPRHHAQSVSYPTRTKVLVVGGAYSTTVVARPTHFSFVFSLLAYVRARTSPRAASLYFT